MPQTKSPLTQDEVNELLPLLKSNFHSFSPFTEYEADLGKKRFLYRTELKDTWVIQALASELRLRATPATSRSVYSYIKGRGPHSALRKVTKKLRETPRTPVYAIRRDVQNYTDSIPTHDASLLWQQIASLFPEETLQKNLRGALRPTLSISKDHGTRMNRVGIPMGLPLTPWIANLYLHPIDEWASSLSKDDLYLRYGDDILYLTRTRERANDFRNEFDIRLAKLGLNSKIEKEANLVLTSNGITDKRDRDEGYTPRSSFEYLGRRVLSSGHIGITGEKRSKLLREVRYRVRTVVDTHGQKPGKLKLHEIPDPLGKAIFGTLQDLWSTKWRGSPRHALLSHEISHPGEWRSLRIDMLREALKILTGSTHFYALRKHGWTKILKNWGWEPIGLSKKKNV